MKGRGIQTMQKTQFILHVDMDAFFAAIEQRETPQYRGKPVIVGADPKKGKGRGVVSTCSYEARKFGVRSALPISQAWELCPHGVYVEPNGELYAQVSKEIFKIFYEFTDAVEPLSIDEAFLDVSGSLRLFGGAVEIAKQIQKVIKERQNLTASVGVAPNKYLAKIASDLEKPNGLVVVEADKIDAFLHPLDISRLWGAGKATQSQLLKMGIKTIGDLATYSKEVLEQKLGKMGAHFYRLAHGIDDRKVEPGTPIKSISNEHTYLIDADDRVEINKTLLYLSRKVGFRLRDKNLKGKTIHLKLRYSDFKTLTRNKTLDHYTDLTDEIYKTILFLFENNDAAGKRIRLLGVGISGLSADRFQQTSLFAETNDKSEQLEKLEDEIINRFGKKSINRAENI
jgi:nucleotidyltransferase/DNA polymerase involved in DNA repair